jgi:ATP-binding cassette subfamily B multidrug efflux pump
MKALLRLLPYYTPYRAQVAAGLLLVVLATGLASGVPWLLRLALDRMRAGAAGPGIWGIAAAMVALALAAGAARYYMREWLNGVSRRIEFDLRNDLFAHLAGLDAAWYARTRTGEIMARLTNDLNAVRMAAGPAPMYLVNTIFGGVFALAFMLRISPRLTLLAVLPMVFLPVIMVRLGHLIHLRFEAVQEQFGHLTTLAQENLAGVRIVRAYRQERAEVARFDAMNEEYVNRNMRLAYLYGAMQPGFGLIAGLGAVVVLGVGGAFAVSGRITVGEFVAFGFYLAMLTWPLIALGWVINLFQRGGASMARLLGILDARPGIASPERTRELPAGSGGRSLTFRGVGFHYPAAEGHPPRWVLRDVSFHVPA